MAQVKNDVSQGIAPKELRAILAYASLTQFSKNALTEYLDAILNIM
jgi:hypothetical protein